MALTSCPECEKEISDKAASCPHCGYPIRGQNVGKIDQEIQEQKKNDASKSSEHQHNKGGKSKKADKSNTEQTHTKVQQNRSFRLTTKSDHSAGGNAWIGIGLFCLIIHWMALYGGGDWGDGSILQALENGNIGRSIGNFIGGSFLAITSLGAGLVIRKRKEGILLMVVAGITIFSTIFLA